MPFRSFQVPVNIDHLQQPALERTPVQIPLDLTGLARAAGLRLLPDPKSLVVEHRGALLPTQFSPDPDFEAAERCRGTLLVLAPRGERTHSGASVRARLLLRAAQDEPVLRLPYPPRSAREVREDGTVPAPPLFPRMQLIPEPGGQLHVEEDGRLVTAYRHDTGEPKPYLFPLIGPSGAGLTRLGHPHDPGETHGHHRSAWVGFRGVNGENFWEERSGGSLRHRRFERMEDGPACARFVSEIDWISRAGSALLQEQRDVTIYASGAGPGPNGGAPSARLMDFVLRFRGADGAVSLDKTSFGFLAVRVAKSMGVFDGGGVIRNSEGGINEPGVFWKPARWCDYSGPVNTDRWNGIAFLDHPSNPRHPTPWHVRPDGWMGAAPATHSGMRIPAGEWLKLRYRWYLHLGDAPSANVEAAWHDFAYPARVRLGKLEPAPAA
jgi:hypothetical protein